MSDQTDTKPPETAEETTVRNVVFAAPADDPRARRPADVATLIVALLLTLVFAAVHRAKSDIDERVLDFLSGDLPDWLSGTATIVFITGGLYTLGLIIGIAVFGKGRGAIVRDMLVAAALAGAAIIGLAYLGGRSSRTSSRNCSNEKGSRRTRSAG